MFEDFENPERQGGFKGFLDRHVRPPRDTARAEEVVQRLGVFFLSLAVVSGLVGPAVYGNPGSLWTGLALGLTALALYWSRSRTAALILLGLVLGNAFLHPRAPFSWLWVVLAARATQAAFSYRRPRG